MVGSRSLAVAAALFGSLLLAACDSGKNNGGDTDLGRDAGGGNGVNVTISIVGDGSVVIDGSTVCTDESDPCIVNVVVGGSTSVAATPSEGSEFVSWNCAGNVSTNTNLDIPVTAGASCTVTFKRSVETLTVTLDNSRGGMGGGTVTSAPGSIACTGATGAVCSGDFEWGTAVTLTAVPDGNFTFVGWSGDCAGDSPSVDVVIMAATACKATFTPMQYPLTLSVVGTGQLTASTAAATNFTTCNMAACAPVNVDAPLEVAIVASPGANMHIAGWAGDCDSDPSSTSDSVVMDAARSCVVTFAADDRMLTLSTTGGGAVIRDPLGTDATGGFAYTHGTSVMLTAVADENQTFVNWTGDCSGNTPTITIAMDQDRSCVANFTATLRTLTVTAGANGAVTSTPAGIDTTSGDGSEQYPHGSTVTLTTTAATNFEVAAWTGACASAGKSATATVVMNGDQTCGVTFALQKRILSVDVNGSGKVTSSPAGINTGAATPVDSFGFDHGTVVTLTAAENTGPTQISFNGWGGDCVSFGLNKMATVTMTQARNCIASFTVTPYDLTVATTPTGGGNVAGNIVGGAAVINCGTGGSDCSEADISSDDDVLLTATPTAGWRFDKWSGCSTATTATITVQMNADRTCTAAFVRRGTVTTTTASGGANSTATVASTAAAPNNCAAGTSCTVDGGISVSLVATPGSGYRFGSWSGTNCSPASTTSATTTLTVAAGTTHQCIATFVQRGVVTTSTASGGANSTATVSSTAAAPNNCAAGTSCTVDGGTSVTLTATAGSGYRFVSWSGTACNATSATALSTTLTVAAGTTHQCVATFLQLGTVAVSGGTGVGSVTVAAGAPPYTAVDQCAPGASCTAKGGTSVTISATAASGYRFNNWTGCTTASSTSATTTSTIIAGSNVTCTATFTKQYTVTYTVSPVNGGTVASTCGASPCTVDSGTNVRLTATAATTPAPGYRFVSFAPATGGTCNFTQGTDLAVTADQNCVVNFAQLGTLAVMNGTGGNTVTVAAGAPPYTGLDQCAPGASCTAKAGTTLSLVATAQSGYRFNNWTGTGCTATSTTSATTSATIPAGGSVTCTANYTRQFTVTAATSVTGAVTGATVSLGGACTQSGANISCVVDSGAAVTFAANTPSAQHRFAWSCTPASPSGTWSNTTRTAQSVTVAQDVTCTASFVQQFTATAVVNASAGVTNTQVTLSGACTSTSATTASCNVDVNGTVGFAASTPTETHRFAWSCTPASPSGTWNNAVRTAQNVTMTQAVTCTANFTRQFTVTYSAATGGTIAGVCGGSACGASPVIVDANTNVQLNASASTTPAPGYTFASFTGSGCTFTANNQTRAITADQTCVANFRALWNLNVSVAPTAGGTLTGAGINCGTGGSDCSENGMPLTTSITLTAAAASGYRFDSWSGTASGCSGSASSITVGMPGTTPGTFTCAATFTPYWAHAFYPDITRSGIGYAIGLLEDRSAIVLGAFEQLSKGATHWLASLGYDGKPSSDAMFGEGPGSMLPRRFIRDGREELVVVGEVGQMAYVMPLDSAYRERSPGARYIPNDADGKGPYTASVVNDAIGNKSLAQIGIVGAASLQARGGAQLGRLVLVDQEYHPKFDGYLTCGTTEFGSSFNEESNLTAIQASSNAYYVAGTAKYGEQYLALVVARVRSSGEVEWVRSYHGWDPTKGEATRVSIVPTAIADAGSTIIVVGGYQPSPAEAKWIGMAITLRAETGDVLWKDQTDALATYSLGTSRTFWKDVEIADKNAIVTGRFATGEGASDAIAAYLDRESGALKAASTYGGSDADFDGLPGFNTNGGELPPSTILGSYRPAFVTPIGEGGYALAGSTSAFKAGGGSGERPWVIRINENLTTGPKVHPEFTYKELKIPTELRSALVSVYADKNGTCDLKPTDVRADAAVNISTKNSAKLRPEVHAGTP